MRDIWTEIQGIKIHVVTAGQGGIPLILLHGGGLDWATLSFRQCIEPFSQYRLVIAPDWPGFGESDKPLLTYSTDFFVSILKDSMDILNVQKADIAGISMGGAIAARFALKFQPRVNKLILIDSYGLADRVPRHFLAYVVVHSKILSKMVWYTVRHSRTILGWALRNIVYNPSVITPLIMDEVNRMAHRPHIERGFTSWLRTEIRWERVRTDLRENLHEIRVPTLFIHGNKDKSIPVIWAEKAHKTMANSELCIFDKCGHWPPWEKRDEFVNTVLRFLQ